MTIFYGGLLFIALGILNRAFKKPSRRALAHKVRQCEVAPATPAQKSKLAAFENARRLRQDMSSLGVGQLRAKRRYRRLSFTSPYKFGAGHQLMMIMAADREDQVLSVNLLLTRAKNDPTGEAQAFVAEKAAKMIDILHLELLPAMADSIKAGRNFTLETQAYSVRCHWQEWVPNTQEELYSIDIHPH